MIKGIDISSHQGNINFDILKSAVDFVIIKATEGTGFTDSKFLRNQTEARRTGMLLGYYHFARPDLGNTPEAEADWFLSVCKPKKGEVLALDYEPPSYSGDTVSWCKKWLDRVYNKTGCRPLIYLNQTQVKNFNWKPIIDANYGLWLAAYTPTLPKTPWSVVAMQQTSSSGTISGIAGRVDTNLFFGDKTAFKKYGLPADIDPCVAIKKELEELKIKYDSLVKDHKIALTHISKLIESLKTISSIVDDSLK